MAKGAALDDENDVMYNIVESQTTDNCSVCTGRKRRFILESSISKEELFRSAPVGRAIAALAVPTILSQLITVIYNMADTFFIGQMDDPNQVAAATVIMPLFM